MLGLLDGKEAAPSEFLTVEKEGKVCAGISRRFSITRNSGTYRQYGPCQTLNSGYTNKTYRLDHTIRSILGTTNPGNRHVWLGMDHRLTAPSDPNDTYVSRLCMQEPKILQTRILQNHTHMLYESVFNRLETAG